MTTYYVEIFDGTTKSRVSREGEPTIDDLLSAWWSAMRDVGYQEMTIRRAVNRNTAEAIQDADGATGG